METSYLQSVMPVCTSQVAVHSMSVQTRVLYEVTDGEPGHLVQQQSPEIQYQQRC